MHWSELVEDGIVRIRCDHNPHAYVAQSALIPGEEGLFADRCFKSGDTVAVFTGKTVPFDAKIVSRYVIDLVQRSGKVRLDCEHTGAPYAHKINDARGTGRRTNCKILKSGRVVCSKTVQRGAEFLTSYGPAYWRLHGDGAQGAT